MIGDTMVGERLWNSSSRSGRTDKFVAHAMLGNYDTW